MYTKEQKNLIDHVAQKVEALFSKYYVPAHGIEHVSRVVHWTKKIAEGEQVRSRFLCELAAWTHDIGRTREDHPGETSRKHHELSYEMLREWYREDRAFDILSDEEKLELLYAVRYHWNDVADKYDTAWILRDADKLDGFGDAGISRMDEHFGKDGEKDEKGYNQHFRNTYQTFYHIRTQTARDIILQEKLMEPIDNLQKKYLEKNIEEVEL